MKNEIFPFEMINHNVESLNAKHHQTTKILYLVVLAFLIIALTATFFIEVNVSTQSRGIIRTESENNQLHTAVAGQIDVLNIKENQAVKQGDTLLIISAARLEEQIRFQEEQRQKNITYIKDLQALVQIERLSQPTIQTALYHQEYLQYQQRANELTLKINYAQQNAQRTKELLVAGTIAQVEADQKNFELDLAQNAVKVLKEQQVKTWQLELQQYTLKNQEIASTISQLKKEEQHYILTAPINGTITQFSGLQKGNFVSPSQIIASISADDGMIVESYVSPADIGLIQKGMDVKFQIDAYNYNQWGLATGEVVDISKDIDLLQEQPFFRVRCSINEDNLSLKNGYEGNFKKGMTLTARYSITERTVFQLLYDTMDDWLNPNMG